MKLELTFRCNKCKRIEIVDLKTFTQEQPFCLKCAMPMFIVKAALDARKDEK